MIRSDDEHKCAIVISHEQYLYFRMRQRLKRAAVIYTQFENLVFESLSKTEEILSMSSLIEKQTNEQTAFSLFMNDHCESVTSFNIMYIFLHEKYFSRVVFESIYLFNSKTHVFFDSLKMMRFIEEADDLRSFIKHREKILH